MSVQVDPTYQTGGSRHRKCAVKTCHAAATERRPRPGVAFPETLEVCRRHAAMLDEENAMNTCSHPDCSRPHKAKGLCSGHYEKARRDQEQASKRLAEERKAKTIGTPVARAAREQGCQVLGCTKPRSGRGRCSKHYYRAKVGGWLDADPVGDEARWAEHLAANQSPKSTIPVATAIINDPTTAGAVDASPSEVPASAAHGPCRCGGGYDSDGDGDCPACAEDAPPQSERADKLGGTDAGSESTAPAGPVGRPANVALRLEVHRDHDAVTTLSKVQRALDVAGFRFRDLGDGPDNARVAVVTAPSGPGFRTRLAVALATYGAEDIAAEHTTAADDDDLIEHVLALREAAEQSEARQQQIDAAHRALDKMPSATAPDCNTPAERIRYATSAWQSEREEASHLAALCQGAHDALTELGDCTEGTPSERILALHEAIVERSREATHGRFQAERRADSAEAFLTDAHQLLLWVRGALRGVDVALQSAEEQEHAQEVAGGIAGTLAAVRAVIERLELEVKRG